MGKTYRKTDWAHYLRRMKTSQVRRKEHGIYCESQEEGWYLGERQRVRGNLTTIPNNWDDLVVSALDERKSITMNKNKHRARRQARNNKNN